MTRLRRSGHPGFLIPLLLAGALATDAALRLGLPADRVSYRVWEAMRTFGAATPFRPAARYDRPRVYGNLAALGNQPDLRQYHRVVFTTDSLGYHNPPDLAASGQVAALLFGSSFSAGTEVGDGEDFAAQLSRLAGCGVYNAAPGDPVPSSVQALAHRLGIARGVVIYEYFAGTAAPGLHAVPPAPESVRCRRLLGPWSTPHRCRDATRLAQRLRISPLAVFAGRATRRARDDHWLPNLDARRVVRARLANGDEMLFLGDDEERTAAPHPEASLVRYADWLRQQLAPAGLSLLVVLVPEKQTVYAELLEQGAEVGAPAEAPFLEAAERALRAQGVPVVNLAGPLRDAARSALSEGGYVYWRDDTHWNAAGVRVAAEAVAPALRAVLAERPEAAAARARAARTAQ